MIAAPLLRRSFVVTTALWLAACASPGAVGPRADPAAHYALRLIGVRTLDHRLQFGGTTVGGLSGIDYDADHDTYYLISDDRSAFAPTRFYTARLRIDAEGFHDAALQTVVTLRGPDGQPYPLDAADAEAIRYDRTTGTLWWSSEGQRRLAPLRLTDPFVRHAALDGRHLGEVPLDPMFRMSAEPRGPRDNIVFEGLSLSPDGRSLWVAMEGPLLQDGPMPTMSDGAWSRISRHDRDPRSADGFGPLVAQYAYRIDPIPAVGAWTSLLAQTGVSEILAIDDRLLVLERALVLGAGWRIRLFEADARDATDVKSIDSLREENGFTPMTKHLVLDFDALGVVIDNLEGLCFGPTLANGHRTLVLVADDNFNAGETTQLIALEIVPR